MDAVVDFLVGSSERAFGTWVVAMTSTLVLVGLYLRHEIREEIELMRKRKEE